MSVWTELAHTVKGSPDLGPVTSDAIDTTGAKLLLVMVGDYDGTSVVTDSKGNSWTALDPHVSANFGGGDGAAVRLHYCILPSSVGAGHTFTATGLAPAIEVLAFDGPATPTFDQQNGDQSTGPSSSILAGSITPSSDNSLILTGYSDRLAYGGTGVFSFPSVFADYLQFASGQHYTVGVAYFEQSVAGAQDALWNCNITFTTGQAATIASFTGGDSAPPSGPPIAYQDPCTIDVPLLYMKVTTEDETFKMAVEPLRESTAQGGPGIPRLVGVSPIKKVASDPFSGTLGAQTAALRNADTDRVLRAASATRTSFRHCSAEVYLTSRAQSLAGGPPRVLLAGLVQGNSADESLVQGFDVNDPIGAGYSVNGEDAPLVKRRIGLPHFPNCPPANIAKPEQYVIGRRAPLDVTKGEGVVLGTTVGPINIGGAPGTPTSTTLADLVAALQTSKDAGTLDADWGWTFGHADVISLQGYGGSVPADFDTLAYGTGSFIGLGAGDISAYLDGAATTGGTTSLAVLISSAAISEVLMGSNGDPSLWIDDTQIDPAELGNSVWCPQIPGFEAHWAGISSDLFTDIVGTDGVTRRYTLVLFDPASPYGLQLFDPVTGATGAQFHLDCIGAEDVGDGTGDPFDEYFECYLEVIEQLGLQTYYSGARLTTPQFLFSDGVTLVDRVDEASFARAAAVWAQTLPAGLKMSATLTDESFRDFLTQANICGGCQFANDDFGRYFVKVLDRRRSEFFKKLDDTTHPTLIDRFDILPGFHVDPRPDWQVNVLTLQYGKNEYTGAYDRDGTGGAAPIQHAASRTLHGDLPLTREYRYVADDATAAAVGAAFVALFGYLPYVASYARPRTCALEDDVLQGVPLTHYNGFGPNGFQNYGVWPFERTFHPEMYAEFQALCVDFLLDAEDEPLPRVVADYPVNAAILVDADTGFVLVNGA